MGKTHRGANLKKEVPRSGRGFCSVTKRTGVKLLYEYELDGKKIKLSKLGWAILENKRKRQEKKAKRAVAEEAQSTENVPNTPETNGSDVAESNATESDAPESAEASAE